MPEERTHRHRAVEPAQSVAGGALYVVATPLGDPDDITIRAVRVLGAVDLVAAEDTRVTARLLAHHGIGAKLVSHHDHNEDVRIVGLVARLQGGASIALVSDAGTPLVNDPGFPLVRACIAAGVPVHVVPGPSSVISALVGSGLAVDRFHFLGFAGHKPTAFLAEIAALRGTLVFFESPVRLHATLDAIAELWPARRVCVARNLTKVHEQWIRGTAREVHAILGEEERGEVVVVVEGARDDEVTVDVDGEIDRLRAEGLSDRSIRDQLAARTGMPRREIYARTLARR